MKCFRLALAGFCLVSVMVPATGQETKPDADGKEAGKLPPPVPFQPLAHYAPLWERSVFTTRDLSSPDAPAGPLFTDSLSLSGIYEVDGQVVAVLVDRNTSLISEARLDVENEAGIKIRKITPGASMDKTRVQLQKGDVAGWVSFAEASAQAAPAQPPGLDTRRPAASVPGARPPSQGALTTPLLPPPVQPEGSPQAPADVPLPPP